MDCAERPKRPGHPKWCTECWLRRQPMSVRVAEAEKRYLRIPEALRRDRVPKEEWPAGRRWCSGCQTFVSLRDVASGAARCRPCISGVTHRSYVAKTYGIPEGDYDRMLEAQNGLCAICLGRPVSKRLAVDHDHKTNEVRGLLCSRCNHDLLGAAHDSLDLLLRAVDYLRNPPYRKLTQ